MVHGDPDPRPAAARDREHELRHAHAAVGAVAAEQLRADDHAARRRPRAAHEHAFHARAAAAVDLRHRAPRAADPRPRLMRLPAAGIRRAGVPRIRRIRRVTRIPRIARVARVARIAGIARIVGTVRHARWRLARLRRLAALPPLVRLAGLRRLAALASVVALAVLRRLALLASGVTLAVLPRLPMAGRRTTSHGRGYQGTGDGQSENETRRADPATLGRLRRRSRVRFRTRRAQRTPFSQAPLSGPGPRESDHKHDRSEHMRAQPVPVTNATHPVIARRLAPTTLNAGSRISPGQCLGAKRQPAFTVRCALDTTGVRFSEAA